MSGDQQQLLAIARSLMTAPKIVVIDEPSVGLAPIVVRDVLNAITELREKSNMTIFMPRSTASRLGVASVATWNAFIFVLCFATDSSVKTLPVGLAEFSNEFNPDWGAVMAASMVKWIELGTASHGGR